MPNVITLIANPAIKPLDERIINKIFIKMEKAKASIANLNWLAENEACDISFDGISIPKAQEVLYNILEELPYDTLVQETQNRRKKLLICDMDSTIINQECIDEIAATLGLKDKVAAITEQAMNGEIDFADALRERVALLEGVAEDTLEQVYKEQITLMSGAKTLVRTMTKNGASCILVSGGFTFFTQKVSQTVGFAENYANILEIKDGKLSGKVVEPVLDRQSKLETLQSTIKHLNIESNDVAAAGDGANDLPMLKAAGLGVAYHAKPAVKAQAAYKIDHNDLTSLLYAQGYKKEDFIHE